VGGDRPVLDPYPVNAMCDAAHAAPLIPGPTAEQTAILGFLPWQPWEVTAQTTSRVRMGALLTATKLPVISEAQVLAERLRGFEMRRG
jgi:hypothetical protein